MRNDAEPVPELVHPIRSGRLFVVILCGRYYQTAAFEAALRRLESGGAWRFPKLETFDHTTELDRPGRLLAASQE